ncbi:prolipoprotein diacylglyceryl transferase [uncultured Corynebacterium sp.]|uniref:prolipoprotein diacylglyceryl transferase n=1 Tax=uncultured Corynebacterium sp. TaxID=159447 RepID=UPI0025E9E186|nr:prolipoprotein diacylglyceryl transferase [uncultured Corynebacterium sp.]
MLTTYLANIPSPPQGVWYLGPIPIRAYALCILTGVVVAYFWTRKRYADRGGDPEVAVDALLVAIPAGIIGARLYHVITDHDKYFGPGRNPVDALKITNGGLGIWGGIVAGSLAVWLLFKFKKVPLSPFADAAAPTIALAQAIGRLGNWFNQELYGGPSTAPWALEIYERVDGRSTGQVLEVVQPTFLYELLWNLLVVVFLLAVERITANKGHRIDRGRLFMLYVAAYTFGRYFIENMRTDPATTVFGDIRINVVVSAVVFAIAVGLFVVTTVRGRRNKNKETNPSPQ